MQRAATLLRNAATQQAAAARRPFSTAHAAAAATMKRTTAPAAAASSPLACALRLGAQWRAAPAASPLFGSTPRRHMSSAGGASGAASSSAAGAGAGAGTGAAASGAVDPTVAASMLNKASAAVASGPATPLADAAPTVGAPLGGDELTSLYPALDPDSWLHILPAWVQSGLELIHAQTGLPWVGSIMLTILAARACMFPLHVLQARAASGAAAAVPELTRLRQAHAAVAAQYSRIGQVLPMDLKLSHEVAINEVNSRNGANYKLLKMLGPGLASMPLFISFFVAIRAMGHVDPSFCTGGVLWFPNLAELDPTYALPFLNACTIALTAWVNSRFVIQESTTISRFMTKAMYVMAALSFPFSAWNMPAGVIIYWITNGWILMAQGFLLRNKTAMRILGIRERPKPTPKDEAITPGSVAKDSTLSPAQRAEAERIKFYAMKRELRNANAAAAAAAAAGTAAPAAAAPNAPPLNPFLAAPATPADAAAKAAATGDFAAFRAAVNSGKGTLGVFDILNSGGAPGAAATGKTSPAVAALAAATAMAAPAASSARAVKGAPKPAPVVPAKPLKKATDKRGRR